MVTIQRKPENVLEDKINEHIQKINTILPTNYKFYKTINVEESLLGDIYDNYGKKICDFHYMKTYFKSVLYLKNGKQDVMLELANIFESNGYKVVIEID